MSSQSLAALRAYVCAPGQAGGANQAESTVRLNVEHVALKATRFAELRLDKHVSRLILVDDDGSERRCLSSSFGVFLHYRSECLLFFSVAERH